MSDPKSAMLLLSLVANFQDENELVERAIEALIEYRENKENKPFAEVMTLLIKWNNMGKNENPIEAFTKLSKDLDDFELGKQYVDTIKNNKN